MSNIVFRIAAKTDVGCVRTNNEDNFQASADLSQTPMRWINNQSINLGPKGALLVVADGMGGMNAGEVASEIAINTVKEYFTPERLTPEVMRSRQSIDKYMRDVVIEADRRIKASSTVETKGMGTTIVMAWLLDGKCYVCWCGDSRAYIYNPANGLFQISKDHSYVQGLVDEGKISEEDAFDFPDSNIITRCLCDAKNAAEPEVMLQPQPLCNGDIIMLCSDGLSGMLRDRDMQQIIRAQSGNLDVCADELVAAAKRAGGTDNITVAMAQIEQGGAVATPDRVPAKTAPLRRAVTPGITAAAPARKPLPMWLGIVIGVILAAGIFTGGYFIFRSEDKADKKPVQEVTEDNQPPINTEVQNSYEVTPTPSAEDVIKPKNPTKPVEKPKSDKTVNGSKTNSNGSEGTTGTPSTPNVNPGLKAVGTIGGTGTSSEGGVEVNTEEPKEKEEVKAPETKPAEPLTVVTYKVRKGDTLGKIANKFKCSIDDIKKLNSGLKDDAIKEGQEIFVPKKN